MKTKKVYILNLFILLIISTSTLFAQWSAPVTLFPGSAYPEQFLEENPISPVMCSLAGDDGLIYLIWSNKEGNNVNLVYSKKTNGTWSPIGKIADFDPVSLQPTAVFDSNGTLHCAWISVDQDDNFSVYYSRLFEGQDWETPVKLSDPAYMLNAHPRLVKDNAGNVRLFYNAATQVGNIVNFYIKHYIVDQSSPNVSTIQQPSPAPGSIYAFNPHVYCDHQGKIHCFWYNHNGGEYHLLTSNFDGFEWSPSVSLASTASGTYIFDENPIVVDESSDDEIIALWLSLDPETAQYRKYNDNIGWGDLVNTGDGTFRNANGFYDSQNYLHIVGNEDGYRGGHLYHHVLSGEIWQNAMIEAGTEISMPGYPSIVLKNDTIFCYYLRFTLNGNELVESYTVLNHLTPVGNKQPFNDFSPIVSPNPVTTNSKLQFQAFGKEQVVVSLYNIYGAELKSITVQGSTEATSVIGISQLFDKLSKGVYMLRIFNGNIDKTLKLIVP